MWNLKMAKMNSKILETFHFIDSPSDRSHFHPTEERKTIQSCDHDERTMMKMNDKLSLKV